MTLNKMPLESKLFCVIIRLYYSIKKFGWLFSNRHNILLTTSQAVLLGRIPVYL